MEQVLGLEPRFCGFDSHPEHIMEDIIMKDENKTRQEEHEEQERREQEEELEELVRWVMNTASMQ